MGKTQARSDETQLEKVSQRRPWRKRSVTWIAVAVVVVALGGGAYGFIYHRRSADASAVMEVRWTQATRTTVSKTASFSGTLTPRTQATVTTTGTLESVSVKVGDKVKKGQVLAHTDTTSAENQVTQDKASLEEAEAKLAESEETTTTTDAQGESETQAADTNVVAQAKASVTEAKAQLQQDEDTLDACTVKSSIAGTVVQVANVDGSSSSNSSSSNSSSSNSTGSSTASSTGTSGSGTTVATIMNLSSSDFEVDADVAQSDVSGIHAGQTASISLSSTSGVQLTGTVESVSMNPSTSSDVTTYPVVVKVKKPSSSDVSLLPGASVTVDVVEKQAKNVVAIPTAAIVNRGGQTGVYVESSDATSADASSAGSRKNNSGGSSANLPSGLAFQPITVGLYGENMVQIKSGLKAGESVAILSQSSSSSANSTQESSSGLGSMGMMTGGLSGAGGSGGGFPSGGKTSTVGGGQS